MEKFTQNKIAEMCIPSDSTLTHALEVINRCALGAVFMVDDQTERFVAILTDGDIRRALLRGCPLLSTVESIKPLKSIVARVGMTSEQIAELFSDEIRIIPILDSNDRIADVTIFEKRIRLPVAEPILGNKELEYVSECILTGWVSSKGKFVELFEQRFQAFCHTRHAIVCSNGTVALHLALLSVGIGSGDEVIVPTLSFIATANAVTYTGAHPVLVDSECETWNIDPKLIEERITEKTKAIIAVHLYGQPADMDPILEIAEKYNLCVIEDAAEAHGATYKGIPVGSIGDIGTFSFYGNKIITTGEGGMVVTNDMKKAEKIRMLRDHGMSKDQRYWHPIIGYNYRMTNIQAAIGVAQMEKINMIISQKRSIAVAYRKGLHGVNGITLPPHTNWSESVYWLFSILVDEGSFGVSASQLMLELSRIGVETRPVFVPIHDQPIYRTEQKCPVSEQISKNGISLPSAVSIKDDEIEKICREIKRIKHEIA